MVKPRSTAASPSRQELRHARDPPTRAAPLLVRADADVAPGRRPQTLHAAGREDRAVEDGQRPARRAARPLLPPHGAALQGFCRGRPHRLRLPRLDVRGRWPLRAHPAEQRRRDPRQRLRAGLPLPAEVRLRVGGTGRPAARHPGLPGRRRAGLSPHLPVLRGVEDQPGAHDGELLRQLALLLRAQGQLRPRRPAQTRALPVHRDRLRLRGRSPRCRSATRRPATASPAPPSR